MIQTVLAEASAVKNEKGSLIYFSFLDNHQHTTTTTRQGSPPTHHHHNHPSEKKDIAYPSPLC